MLSFRYNQLLLRLYFTHANLIPFLVPSYFCVQSNLNGFLILLKCNHFCRIGLSLVMQISFDFPYFNHFVSSNLNVLTYFTPVLKLHLNF